MPKIPLINFNSADKRKEIIQFYIEIFDETPSMAHMVRAFTQMEKLILEKYTESKIAPNERLVMRFDKAKNLALGNNNIPERKNAFFIAVKFFEQIAEITLEVAPRK